MWVPFLTPDVLCAFRVIQWILWFEIWKYETTEYTDGHGTERNATINQKNPSLIRRLELFLE